MKTGISRTTVCACAVMISLLAGFEAGAATREFVAAEDASLMKDSATTNDGKSQNLKSDASPVLESLLKFNVTGLTGSVTSAKIRLYVTNPTADGPAIYATSTQWSETAVNYSNRPARTTGILDDRGLISSPGVWVEYNVTSVVKGNGTFSFNLASVSTDGAEFGSRESANPPRLVIIETDPVTPPSGLLFKAVEDGTVLSDSPSLVDGKSVNLKSDGSPLTQAFLKFNVSGITGSVTSAKLRLYVTNPTADGPALYATSTQWSESTLNYSNRPARTTGILGDLGLIANPGVWVEYNVASVVKGNGTFSFNLASVSSDGAEFSSRETTNAPQLVITQGTTNPSPSPSPTSSGAYNPSPDVPMPSVTYSGPLVITKGGIYSGNWESKHSDIAAVDVQTDQPVIIEKCNIRGAGYLIKSWNSFANITVRNCRGYGNPPTAYSGPPKPRKFLAVTVFKNIVVENNYWENIAGIGIGYSYKGNRTPSETIKIRYNKVKNINGQIHGGYDVVQFVQFNFKYSIPHAEIAYNEVINQPGKAHVEDNINIFNTKGASDSPILIHNNYIEGAFYHPNVTAKYTGGGILADSPGVDEKTASGTQPVEEYVTAYVHAFENQVVGSRNYAMGIAGGNNIRYWNNRVVNSDKLSDGRLGDVVFPNSWPSGFWAQDYYGLKNTFNNVFKDNTTGIVSWGARKDYSSNLEGTTGSGWKPLPNPIDLDVQKNEYKHFIEKLRARGKFVGPR